MVDFAYVCGMASDNAPGETGHDYDHEVHAPEGFCGTGFSDVRRGATQQSNTARKHSVECRYCGKQGLTWFQPNIGRYRLKDQDGSEHVCQEYFGKLDLAAQPAQRKPLDDKTLWEMWVESPSDVLRFARAIERAHGIGGDE